MFEPSDLDWAIAARVGMGHPPIGPLTREQDEEERSYEEFCAEQENMCSVGISTGGFDPYGTHCDLEHGHEGPHQGPDFFGDGRLVWKGGGTCVGDPLPFTILEHRRAES